MVKITVRWLLLFMMTTFPFVSLASVPAWKIIPAESNLTFTATQNGAPVTGQFKSISGEINFDPNDLGASNVKIVINLASISDAYAQVADTLKTADWFNIKSFPRATFKSNEISKTGDKTYEMKGDLTLRDKTAPVTLTFTEEEYTKTRAKMTGSTTIKRSTFGVGQGEWADTRTVKDDVQISFVITGAKAK